MIQKKKEKTIPVHIRLRESIKQMKNDRKKRTTKEKEKENCDE